MQRPTTTWAMLSKIKQAGRGDSCLQKALSLKPNYAAAHRNLSSLVKYKSEDTQVTLVGEIIQRSDLKDDDRCHLHYTLLK